MTVQLKDNWQFLLSSALRRGEWFINSEPEAIALQILPVLNNQNFSAPTAERIPYNISLATANAISGIPRYGEFGKLPENSVAIFPVKGDMLKYGTMCSYGTSEIAEFMEMAAAEPKIIGAVLDIDSGGGCADSIPPMLKGIDAFKAQGKPIVSVADLCCSAAYYTAAKCDYIFADNDLTSMFGSIGVMASWLDVIPHLEKLGYKAHTVYADESPDKNAEWKKAQAGEYEEYKKEMLSPLAVRFQNDVKAFRGARLKADAKGVISGKAFFGKKAKENGLIDGFLSVADAVKFIFEYTQS